MTQRDANEVPILGADALGAFAEHTLGALGSGQPRTPVDDVARRVLSGRQSVDAQNWTKVVDAVAHALDLRTTWRIGRADDLQAHGTEIWVTWVDGHLMVIGRHRAVFPIEGAPPQTPTDVRPWVRIDAALPASHLQAKSPWTRALNLVRFERDDLWSVANYSIGIGLLGLVLPVAVQVLVNTVALGTLQQPLFALILGLALALSVSAALTALQRVVVEHLQRRVVVSIMVDLSTRLARTPPEAWKGKHPHLLVHRAFDAFTAQKAAGSVVLEGISAVIQAAIGIVILGLWHPLLLGFTGFLIVSVGVIIWSRNQAATKAAIETSYRKYDLVAWLDGIVRHPAGFHQSGGVHVAASHGEHLARQWLDARQRYFRAFHSQFVGSLALQAVAATLLFGIGGFLVLQQQLSLGQLVAAELIVGTLLASFVKLAEKLEALYDLLAGLDKLGALLDLPVEACTGWFPRDPDTPARIKARGAAPVSGMTGLNLDLGPGERHAIVETDPARRTLVAELLAGHRVPAEGTLHVDGHDRRDLAPEAARDGVVLLRDEPIPIMNLDAWVAFGRPDVHIDDIRHALDAVGLDPLPETFEDGLETELCQHALTAHAPTRARLILARGLVLRPRLLIVDGLLDGLDPATRAVALDALLSSDATIVLFTYDATLAARFTRAGRPGIAQVSK